MLFRELGLAACIRWIGPLDLASYNPQSVVAPTLFNTGLYPFLIFSAILFEQLSGHAISRRVWIWVTEQRLDWGKDRRYVICRAPPRMHETNTVLNGPVHIYTQYSQVFSTVSLAFVDINVGCSANDNGQTRALLLNIPTKKCAHCEIHVNNS